MLWVHLCEPISHPPEDLAGTHGIGQLILRSNLSWLCCASVLPHFMVVSVMQGVVQYPSESSLPPCGIFISHLTSFGLSPMVHCSGKHWLRKSWENSQWVQHVSGFLSPAGLYWLLYTHTSLHDQELNLRPREGPLKSVPVRGNERLDVSMTDETNMDERLLYAWPCLECSFHLKLRNLEKNYFMLLCLSAIK